jgi:hypothetical protein
MMTLGVGDGSGRLFVYGDYDSIKAAQSISIAAENLAKRVSELQKRRDELQAHNSELHERIVSLRAREDRPDSVLPRPIAVSPGEVKALRRWVKRPGARSILLPCRINISGDLTRCDTCGTEWDTNDRFPPPCPHRGAKP